MNLTIAITWISYALLIIGVSKWASTGNALLPGKVNVVIQAFAYMATYISAVALVGFGGLCNRYGMQMLLVAAGNVWLGTWFVYKYLAWPTRLFQKRYNAKTPAELLSKAYNSGSLRVFLGFLSSVLLIVYGSAVFKGAALIIAGVLPIHQNVALLILIIVVGLSVICGGLRGVLYTEALQGFIMLVGVLGLLFALFNTIGSPLESLKNLSQLPPTDYANNGFLALSSGQEGFTIISMALVTSVGIWAQPQLIQRHFALSSRQEAFRVAPLAMLALVLVVGGMYLACAFSPLIIGTGVTNPDEVVPMMVALLLPEFGKQIFALAVVSASLSTASGLLHIASGCLWKDVLHLKEDGSHKTQWRVIVLVSVASCGMIALKSSSIIAIICTTSWSILASATLVPYLSLLAFGPRYSGRMALASSVLGALSCLGWYFLNMAIPDGGAAAEGLGKVLMNVPPIIVGTLLSGLVFLLPFGRSYAKRNVVA